MLQVSFDNGHEQIGFHFLMFFLKEYRDLQFLFLEVLLTRFWVSAKRLIESHMSPFWDSNYIIHTDPSESIELMA